MVDPRERAKLLLQAAVVSDPLNPAPFVGLAARARVEQNPELACEYLEAARNRLNPVDATTVVLLLRRLWDRLHRVASVGAAGKARRRIMSVAT
jgi:hypothetical protein